MGKTMGAQRETTTWEYVDIHAQRNTGGTNQKPRHTYSSASLGISWKRSDALQLAVVDAYHTAQLFSRAFRGS